MIPVYGAHSKVADEGSPFALLMHELGIQRPKDVPTADKPKTKEDWFEIGKKRKGKSSLTKYTCGCQNAWIGSAEFAATCDKCGNEFVKATAVREVLKELAQATPDDLIKLQSQPGYDVDRLIDEEQEKDWLYHEPTDTDVWEDADSWLDRSSGNY